MNYSYRNYNLHRILTNPSDKRVNLCVCGGGGGGGRGGVRVCVVLGDLIEKAIICMQRKAYSKQ